MKPLLEAFLDIMNISSNKKKAVKGKDRPSFNDEIMKLL